eukprot:4092557-Pleurochrysis_carterae.AAC.1
MRRPKAQTYALIYASAKEISDQNRLGSKLEKKNSPENSARTSDAHRASRPFICYQSASYRSGLSSAKLPAPYVTKTGNLAHFSFEQSTSYEKRKNGARVAQVKMPSQALKDPAGEGPRTRLDIREARNR